MNNNLELFLFTVEEYKRIANALPLTWNSNGELAISEGNNYSGIQIRLMMLRKYFAFRENVYIKTVVKEAIARFPESEAELQQCSDELDLIENKQLEHILSDGTKLNLYETIEDTVYGLYLHSDENRIQRLEKTNLSIRFYCISCFVVPIEKLVFKLADMLEIKGVHRNKNDNAHAALVHLGDPAKSSQNIKLSEFWSNAYGRDMPDIDYYEAMKHMTRDEWMIVYLCKEFTVALTQKKLDVEKLRSFVHPESIGGWKDFIEVSNAYNKIPNPGISTCVEWNEKKNSAYVKVIPHVESVIRFESKQLISDVHFFTIVQFRGEWKIYAFGEKVKLD